MKKLAYIIALVPFMVFGQQPIINSISPTTTQAGEIVNITGSGLSGTNRVYFGGVSVTGGGNITEVSDNLLQVVVPAGATQGPITVVNGNLVAQSVEQFYVSFGGSDHTVYDPEFVGATTSKTDANDICLCDLDGDDLNDVIISHSVTTTNPEISIYRNTSTAATATLSFAAPLSQDNPDNVSGFISNTCGDLDNDGRPELIFTTNQGTNVFHIYVYQNQSPGAGTITMTYVSSLNLRLPNTSGGENRLTRRVRTADMDGDGRSDLVVGNDTDNTLHIYRNISTGVGNFDFGAAFEIDVVNDHTGNIYLADINNDGRTDIISSPFRDQAQQSISNIDVLQNNSIAGTFSFSLAASINNGTDRISNITSGDLDQDGLNDISVVSRDAGTIRTYRNTTTAGAISFVADDAQTSLGDPFGIALGDMNGDGMLDIVSSLAGNDVSGSTILILENTSIVGNIGFANQHSESTFASTQNVCIGDLNGDAKPDIAYTSRISPGADGELAVFANRDCIIPIITPDASQDQCGSADTFTLRATNSPNATYNWVVTDATDALAGSSTTNTKTFRITDPAPLTATIEVTITSADGLCTTEMAQEVYNILPAGTGTGLPTINISTPAPYCDGDVITLSTAVAYDNYFWTLPDGSTSNNPTITLNPATSANSGDYLLRVQNAGECSSAEATQSITINTPPTLEILNNDDDNFCGDGSNDPVLEVSTIAGLNYQWIRNGIDIGVAATSPTYTATESGNYTVRVTDPATTCSSITSAYTVTEVSVPVAAITGPTETCVNFETTFRESSTIDGGFTAVHSWVIEDATNAVIATSSVDTIAFSFPAVGTYEVILTTSYDPAEVASCSDVVTQVVTVSPEPTITFNVTDGVEKCQLDALTVSLTTPDAASIISYDWEVRNAFDQSQISTGTNASIDVTTPIGVDSAYAVVTITTDIGCQVTDSVRVQNFPTDIDISAPKFDPITDSVTLDEDTFIELVAENVTNPAWSPSEIINDTTASRVTVFPAQPFTTVILTGIDANGCLVATTVTIELDNIRPKKTFSPNGDGIFDCWEILNTAQLPNCKIYVFDSRGANILVADSPFPNNCVWDGNFSGSPVPEGVYYYVLKCDDSNLSKSGSILLAR